MKFLKIKTVLGLSVGSAAVILMAACSGGFLSTETETDTSPVTVVAGPLEAKEILFAMNVSEREAAPAPVEPGTLVKGSSALIYYVTDAETLRPIPDHETFAAFSFSPEEVIVVDDDILSTMPVDDALTRLLFDSVGNLYWVTDGKRWWVNEWKRIVHDFPRPDLATSHLDSSLRDRLPVHSLNGKLIGQDSRLYYYLGRFITPLLIDRSYDKADVIDVPSGVLAAYTLQAHVDTAWTKLNVDTQAANVRSGPGVNFEVIGTIDQTNRIIVKARAENSNWLQIRYQGQDAWLAGDLIEDQHLVNLFRPVNIEPVAPEEPQPQQIQVSNVRTEIIPAPQNPICATQPIRGFGTVWQKHPEVRQWLGCPFTNFRRNEHATRAAVQTFQHGWMLWLETDTVVNVDPIYVFFADDHSYIRYGDRQLVDAHGFAPTPQGFYKVGDRFAKVYWEEIGVSGRQRLGYATNEARDSKGAFQEFQNGRMFWAGEADTIYIIYQGNFDFDGDGVFTWTQGWISYEDTFEDPAEE